MSVRSAIKEVKIYCTSKLESISCNVVKFPKISMGKAYNYKYSFRDLRISLAASISSEWAQPEL